MQSRLDVRKTGNDPLDCENNMLTVSKDIYDNTAFEKNGIWKFVNVHTEIEISISTHQNGRSMSKTYNRWIGRIIVDYEMITGYHPTL